MTTKEIRRLWKAQPFRRFTVHMADGRQVRVVHPEFLALSPTGRTMVVYQPDGSFDIIDLPLITDLAIGSNGRPRRRARGRKG